MLCHNFIINKRTDIKTGVSLGNGISASNLRLPKYGMYFQYFVLVSSNIDLKKNDSICEKVKVVNRKIVQIKILRTVFDLDDSLDLVKEAQTSFNTVNKLKYLE